MAPHSSSLAWKIPWAEEPGRLQSVGLLRVGRDWATSLSLFTFMHWRRRWQPTPVFLPGESQGRGAWWGAIYGVAQSRSRLKWLSSSSSKYNMSACAQLLSCVQLCNLMDCSLPGSSVRGIPRQEYWSGLPSPSPPPGYPPDPGIKPTSPALAGGFFTPEPPGKPLKYNVYQFK